MKTIIKCICTVVGIFMIFVGARILHVAPEYWENLIISTLLFIWYELFEMNLDRYFEDRDE